jgi:hypothetical protein
MIAITVEGVLMKPVASTIIPLGRQIYHAFRGLTQIVLVSHETPQAELEQWLWMEGFGDYAAIAPPDSIMGTLTNPAYRVWQCNQLKKRGYNVELVIEPEPDVCAGLLVAGYSVLNFLHAAYAVPSWRPDYDGDLRPWDELSQQVANLAAMKAHDERLKSDETTG